MLVADQQRRLESHVYHNHHYRTNIGEIERRGHLGLAGYLRNYARSLVPDYDDEIASLERLPGAETRRIFWLQSHRILSWSTALMAKDGPCCT